jgi:hypothetical protein
MSGEYSLPVITCDGCGKEQELCQETGNVTLAFDVVTERLLCAECSRGLVTRKLATCYPHPHVQSDPQFYLKHAERLREIAAARRRHNHLLTTDPAYREWLKKHSDLVSSPHKSKAHEIVHKHGLFYRVAEGGDDNV